MLFPCFLSTNSSCIPDSRGPGLYKASKATISSNLVGFNRRINSLIPVDSSWNTAVVLPEASKSKTLGSSKVREFRSKVFSFFSFKDSLMVFTALSITVRVLKPRKSNLTSPIVSTSSLSNWVMSELD